MNGFLWLFSSSMAKYTLSLISLMILARILSPAEFGIVSAALVVIGFLNIFTEIGLGPALIQKESLTHKDIGTASVFSILLGLVATAILLVFVGSISTYFDLVELKDVLPAFSLMIIFSSVSVVPRAMLQRKLKFKSIAKIELWSYFVGYFIVAIPLASYGFGIWGLIIGHISHAAITTILFIINNEQALRFSFSFRSVRSLLSFSAGHTLGRIGSSVALQGDNLVIGRQLGADALGYYTRAYQLMVIPVGLIGGVLEKILFPLMATIQNDEKRLGQVYVTSVSVISFISIPLSGLFILCAPEIVSIILGDQWTGLIIPFQILASILVFRMSYKVSVSICNAKAAVFRKAIVQWGYAIAVIVFAIIGSSAGIIGVSFGVALAVIINYLSMHILSSRLVDIDHKKLFISQFKTSALTLVSFVLVYAIKERYFQSELAIVTLMPTVVMYLVLFAVLILVFSKHYKQELSIAFSPYEILKKKYLK